jgi:hypothetical protein
MRNRALSFLCVTVLFGFACGQGEVAPPGNPPPKAPTTPTVPPSSGGEPTLPPNPSVPPPAVTPPVTTPPVTPTTPTGPEQPPAATPDGGPSAPTATPGGPKGPFTCSLVIGIQATADWFNGGFESMVDKDRWELMAVHSGFVNYWADPKNGIWGSKPSSACVKNADNPDRVILTALYLHWMNATVDEWVTTLTGAVEAFKAKYSNLKNIELATFVRSPGGKACPASMSFKSLILPEQDKAFDMIAAKFPDLVTVAPKVEVASCADYGGNPPHLTGGGKANAAKKMGEIYKESAGQ